MPATVPGSCPSRGPRTQGEAVDAILRFASKEGATCLEHSDFFVAIHLVYLAFQQRTLLQVSPPAASPPSFHHFLQIASHISHLHTRHIANAAHCWN